MHKLSKKKRLFTRDSRPEQIFRATPDVLLTVDHKGRVGFMSRPLAGISPKKMHGHDVTRLFPERTRPWLRRALRNAFQKGTSARIQYPTEESIWWELRLIPPIDTHPKTPPTVMIIASEITSARILQAQAIRHARLATMGVLAASIAHEINNPNNAILFNSAMLERGWSDLVPILDEYHHTHGEFAVGGLPFCEARQAWPALLAEIGRNTVRVKNIVNNLKNLARRDPEQYTETIPIAEPLQAALLILNQKIRKYTDHCILAPLPEGLRVRGHSGQLEQVFINIILNALQALPERSRPVQIRARAEPATTPEWVVVTVTDQGVGIAPTDLTRLTEPFFTTRAAEGGTGLGLSISALIVRNHGGTLHFSQNPTGGTTVTIRLPCHRLPGAVP
ncbi:MAG: PAS domain-containing protein [Magnetococcales bacterium]|nr:PAS domain-containing protein [Magnetococcales bacterium]NGZ07741.1 PAS domain-containing protein [Magnetococcales bacterium]